MKNFYKNYSNKNSFVCPKCFSHFISSAKNRVICPDCKNNEENVEVDELIVPIIIFLNKNNIKTIASCSGHFESNNVFHGYVYYEDNIVNPVKWNLDLVQSVEEFKKIDENTIEKVIYFKTFSTNYYDHLIKISEIYKYLIENNFN